MRSYFFALLFLNVAFFGWARWIASPASATAGAPARVSSLPTLALVKPTVSSPLPRGIRCRTLGPFRDLTGALAVAGALRARGVSPRDRSVDTSVEDGYWVYVDQSKDPAAQRNALARLDRAGIHDVVTMTGAGQVGRISLGIFSDQAHAVRRAEQVRQLGFKPVLDLHQRTISAHWLDIELQSSQPEPPLGQLQTKIPQSATSAGQPAIAFADCPARDASG